MKNFNQFLTGGALTLFLLFSSSAIFAQSGISLSWDSEVGCLDYGIDKHRELPIEDIGDEDCLLVCQESIVTFTVDYGTQPVTDISWQTDGGQILSLSNGDAVAEIEWPLTYPNGNVSVEITLANGQIINGSICVTVKEQPQGGFEILGQVSQYFCSYTELIFENQAYMTDGTQIVASVWDFGDGTTSSEFNPMHTYTNDGPYQVTLTVYDECGCSNIWREDIIVTKPGIIISCPTVVCEGSTQTYTLEGPAYANGDVECSSFIWQVDGGHLINQGQDWIEVLWDSVGEDGFGYVYFDQASCNVTCNNTMVIKVPVIPTEGTISGGVTELCQSDQSRYALPQWPTTDVVWTVTPANNPGLIIAGATILVDQRNEIAVEATALQPGNYILNADYTNTLLKCGGHAEFEFTVLQDLEINQSLSTDEICEGNTADFYLTSTISGVTWTISQGGQTIGSVAGSGSLSHASYQFTAPGHYTVSATANGYCTGYAQIDVIEIPSVTNAAILGSEDICPAQAETYTFDGETGGFNVVWDVDHGSFLGPNVGETVTIQFDDAFTVFEVTAKLVNPNFPDCESDLVILPVELFEPEAQIIQTTGNPNAICASSQESFELQGYPDMDYYEWTILPEELAHVSSGDGTEDVTILFNEPYLGQTQGTITVKAKVCGEMTEIDQVNFELNENPVLTIASAPTGICANESFTIGVTTAPAVPLSSLSISFSAALIGLPTTTEINPGDYEFQIMGFENLDLGETVNVTYTITANGPELCGESQISGNIDRYPAPEIDVYYTGATVFCTVSQINTVLNASVPGSGTQQSTVTWMYGGNPIGTGLTFPLSGVSNIGFGNYTAVVTNNDGCTTTSEPITIIQDCGSGLPSCNGNVSVTSQWTDCNIITYTATFVGNPSSTVFIPAAGFTANNINPLTPTISGNTYTQQFETSASGTYLIAFVANYPGCIATTGMEPTDVEYKPRLLKEVDCGTGGYLVTILNESTLMPGSNPTVTYTYSENGGPTTPPTTQNDNEATATLSDGEYTLTVTLSSPGKPSCSASTQLSLHSPDAAFTIPNSPVCSDVPVILQPDNPTPGATYLWTFQAATNTLESINPTLAGTGSQGNIIYLTVTDPFGCSQSTFETIVVNEAEFLGDILPDPGFNICPNQLVNLTYQNNPFTAQPVDFAWFQNLQPIGANSPILNGLNQAGEYSIQLFDILGCKDATISSVYINLIQPPHLSAEITGSVCAGEAIVLTGSLSPENTEYQIWRSKNNGPYILIQPWTAGPAINLINSSLSVGTYSYKVEYKDPQTDCATLKYFEAVVHPNPQVSVQLDNVTCSPYTVQLTATGNQPGTYLWSNGMSGATIVVDHGGPYQVTFRPDGADCAATATFAAPKSPDVYSWIFPTGCFEYCSDIKDFPYLIGPIPYFEGGYEYNLNGNTVDAAIGVVSYFQIAQGLQGALNLTLNNAFCNITTDFLDITAKECEECNGLINITEVDKITDPTGFDYYNIIDGTIQNPTNDPVTITLSSLHGSFILSVIAIPPGGIYSFASNPILFIPFNPLQGPVLLEYVFNLNGGGENKILCLGTVNVDTEALQGFTGGGGGVVEMRLMPNPAANTAQVHYIVEDLPIFNSGIIKLYSISGRLIESKKVNEAQGQTRFDLSGLASGTYVVVFFSQGQRLSQQILIKE